MRRQVKICHGCGLIQGNEDIRCIFCNRQTRNYWAIGIKNPRYELR